MPDDRLLYLLEKFDAGACTPEEQTELENWYQQLAVTRESFVQEGTVEADELRSLMLAQFRSELVENHTPVIGISRKKILYRWTAAAAIMLIAFVTVYYAALRSGDQRSIIKNERPAPKHDIPPGGNHATLTLADGTTILLDTAKHGSLAQQGTSAIQKVADGLLVYDQRQQIHNGEPVMNRVQTPRGGQYRVKLPDGSSVWLNASSSIEIPAVFAGEIRRVTVSGEVYFEVAAYAKKIPFIVQIVNSERKQLGEVEVLGTHFNINAYDDEASVKSTLLEGSVKVRHQQQSKVLTPGQQALIYHNELEVVNEVDVEEAVAWKNGLFKFNDADIKTILRQASRWYDIEVELRYYDAAERFRGKISRNVSLSEFLRILELNQVSFQREGKKIIIQ